MRTLYIEELYKLGLNYIAQKQTQQALSCFRAINLAAPDFAPAWHQRALALSKPNGFRFALFPIRKALQLLPNDAGVLRTAITIAIELKHFTEALTWLMQLEELNPDESWVELQRVEVYRCLNDYNLAELALEYAQAKGVADEDVELVKLGILRDQGLVDCLMPRLEKLIYQKPDFAEAKFFLAEQQLSRHNYKDGWSNYEARLYLEELRILRKYIWPLWQGEDLKNCGILIYAEQGIGDVLMFASCLDDLFRLASSVVFVAYGRLISLFQFSYPKLKVISFDEITLSSKEANQINYSLPIGSLPSFFRNAINDFPGHNGYLIAADELLNHWQDKLQGSDKLKVGIAWQGGLIRTGQISRSLQPEQLEPLFKLPNIQFINIQHGQTRKDLKFLAEKYAWPVTTFALDTKNISELAGLVSALDLVITPCCTLVHLAGALGKPVWVMTPKIASWRYGNEGESMPCYPSARLFRQTEAGSWGDVIERIREQLVELTKIKGNL